MNTKEKDNVATPVTAINFKSGSHARLQFHGEMGCFSVEGMVHDFQKKGGVFRIQPPWILKKGGAFQKATSMDQFIGWLKAE